MRLDQGVRFQIRGCWFIMALAHGSGKNEWTIRPEDSEGIAPRQFRRLLEPLRRCQVFHRFEKGYAAIDVGWEKHHLISHGIEVRPKWDGQSLSGLLPATACLISAALKAVASTFAIMDFFLADGRRVDFDQFNDWHAVHLFCPNTACACTPGLHDEEIYQLYKHLGLIDDDQPNSYEECCDLDIYGSAAEECWSEDCLIGFYSPFPQNEDFLGGEEEWEEEMEAEDEALYARFDEIEESFL